MATKRKLILIRQNKHGQYTVRVFQPKMTPAEHLIWLTRVLRVMREAGTATAAVQEVLSRITMERVLRHYGMLDMFKRTGTWLSGPCPIHGGDNPTQFRVDTEKNIWNCFSECRYGGNVLDFIAKKECVTTPAAALMACKWFGIRLK